MSLTWASAQFKQSYTLNSSAFNYIVQDLCAYLVSQGFVLVHEGYEYVTRGAGTITSASGSAGTGGHSFFVLQRPASLALAGQYLVIQGGLVNSRLALEVGEATGLPGSWPGSGSVTIPGYTAAICVLYSTTNLPSGGYTDVGALVGVDPTGVKGVHVCFGNGQVSAPAIAQVMAAEFDHGHLTLTSLSGQLVSWTLGGISQVGFTTDSGAMTLGVGSYDIVATCNGETDTRTIQILKDQAQNITLNFSATGGISVGLTPAGTPFTITGPSLPTGWTGTPFEQTGLRVGTYVMTASKAGYRPFSRNIVVSANVTTTTMFAMEPMTGVLRVTTDPSGATVQL